MRPKISEAARMGILSAMLLLGDNLWLTEQKEAFDWYSKAAGKGNATAETALGINAISTGWGRINPTRQSRSRQSIGVFPKGG